MFTLHPQLDADTISLGDLPLCRILLVNDANYPWLILVPRRKAIQEIYQLDDNEQQQLMQESNTVGRLLIQHFVGEKLNVAALGNMVPQLHIHHIVRLKTDPAWPKPVWGVHPAQPYAEKERQIITNELTSLISNHMELQTC